MKETARMIWNENGAFVWDVWCHNSDSSSDEECQCNCRERKENGKKMVVAAGDLQLYQNDKNRWRRSKSAMKIRLLYCTKMFTLKWETAFTFDTEYKFYGTENHHFYRRRCVWLGRRHPNKTNATQEMGSTREREKEKPKEIYNQTESRTHAVK